MKPVPHGEPYAGKLHVRFDEGAGVPDNKGRPALLYTLAPPYLPSKGELLDEIERSRGRTAMRKSAVKAKAGR